MTLRVPRPLSLFLVTVALALLGLGLRLGPPIYRQQVAIREIKKCGGMVSYRSEVDSVAPRRPLIPLLSQVNGVHVANGSTVSCAVWENLQHLRGLEVLEFDGSEFDPDDATKMVTLPTVTIASFTGSAMNDRAIVCLRQLPNTETLFLDWTEVTDASLSVIEGLGRLKELHLDSTKVTDAGFARLKWALPGAKIYR